MRAGDRARTGDSLLGKQVLYQLSYARELAQTLTEGDGLSSPILSDGETV